MKYGNFKYKEFYLHSILVDWEIIKDDMHQTVLVPKKKGV